MFKVQRSGENDRAARFKKEISIFMIIVRLKHMKQIFLCA